MNLQDIMEQAAAMQKDAVKIQEELNKKTVVGAAGGGMVEVTVSGQGDVLKIKIDPMLINTEEKKMLEELVAAAVNDALNKAKKMSKEELGRLAVGFPGISNLMG